MLSVPGVPASHVEQMKLSNTRAEPEVLFVELSRLADQNSMVRTSYSTTVFRRSISIVQSQHTLSLRTGDVRTKVRLGDDFLMAISDGRT